MSSKNIINCSGIVHRQGFIEVQPNIHRGYINLEAWNINPGVALKYIDMNNSTIKECNFAGNVELELDLETAKTLLATLNRAISDRGQQHCS